MGRTGLEGRVLIHLDLLEDFTPDFTGVMSRHPWALKPFRCQQRVIDGEDERQELARPSAVTMATGTTTTTACHDVKMTTIMTVVAAGLTVAGLTGSSVAGLTHR
ncbi:hypothetical protein D1007_39745 [Hordeum vulgare]|nr:hypothetical protein D1007_39745 [Hordeum vulgare]